MAYELVHKPTFTNQLLGVPNNIAMQILKKIEQLREDPSPQPPAKKKLSGYGGKIYRLRSGDWRVLYTYTDGWVTLLGVGNRANVYDDDVEERELVSPPFPTSVTPDIEHWPRPDTQHIPPKELVDPRPTLEDTQPISVNADLLGRLRIPEHYHNVLIACDTLDDLCAADVPDDVRNRVFDCVTSPSLDSVLEQPDYLSGSVDDLVRFKEGDLFGFLLRLSPEQEKFVTWAVDSAGPTLVKGGPGTGKSTVALFRTRAILNALQRSGEFSPRILFTTYTNALVAYSSQLLDNLLGDRASMIDVRTADNLVVSIVGNRDPKLANDDELHDAMQRAIAAVTFNGSPDQQAAQARTVRELGTDYLLAEICSVIEARQLNTVDEYLRTVRSGRKLPLSAMQRTAVWRVRDAFVAALGEMGRQTWQQLRARAEEIARTGLGPEPYDAVIVDEAQDLEPSVLRMLVTLCRESNRLFLTADANQSIYGSGFRWTDVHEQLQFRGRTGVLRANFRSTREIGEAAQSYLGAGILDNEQMEREYVHSGSIPAMRPVRHDGDEAELVTKFLAAAARELHLGMGSCAVLCPTEFAGKRIAEALVAQGRDATYMVGRELDLTRKGIKVLTLQSAKGLEFPIVALAGFPRGAYPFGLSDLPEVEREESVHRARRIVFVGMTRAMRALMVVIPAKATSTVLKGFDPACWNVG